MSEQVKGWLLSANDPATGVEFEEFYTYEIPSNGLLLHERIAAHQAAYPDVPLYLVEATKITSKG